MKPRASDIIGAAMLALVLFALVAVIFVASVGEADRVHREEGAEAGVASWQL